MFISAKQAAEMFGVSAKFLYRLCNEGKISFLRIGSQKLLFDRDKLREELQALMTKPISNKEG